MGAGDIDFILLVATRTIDEYNTFVQKKLAQVPGVHSIDSRIVLERGVRRVFNPGSVGQPRDRDPRAAWASLDRGTLTFHRTEYDVARARADIAAAGLPQESGDRLEIGW